MLINNPSPYEEVFLLHEGGGLEIYIGLPTWNLPFCSGNDHSQYIEACSGDDITFRDLQ